MSQITYAYIRVSSKDQNPARQYAALAPYSLPGENIFVEKISGRDFNLPAYRKLLRHMNEGDTLFIPSIDRLGRNYTEIIEQWAILTKKKRVDIVVPDMPLLDTRTKSDSLTGTFIADIVLQILSYVADTKREHICKRQRAGIAAAKARGVRFGRPPLSRPALFDELLLLYAAHELTGEEAAKELGVSRVTFLNCCRSDSV